MKVNKSLVLACVAGGVGVCTAPALAQQIGSEQRASNSPRFQPQLQAVPQEKSLQPLQVARARLVDGKAVRIGEWLPYTGNQGGTDAPDTIYFDAFEFDTTTNMAGGFCTSGCNQMQNCPGAPGDSRWSFDPPYTNPYATSEMNIAPGAEGAESTMVRFAWMWRPVAPTQMIIGIFTHETFNTCAVGTPSHEGDFDGVLYDFGIEPATAGGYFSSSPDLSSTPGLFHEMPADGSGAYTVMIGNGEDPTTGELLLEISPGTQPMLWGTGNNETPPDNRVGTQGPFGWDDNSPSDGIHTANECYDMTFAVEICPNPVGKMVMFMGEPISILPGACCLPSGTCEVLTLSQCRAARGIFQGDEVPCASVVCRDPGACCMPDGACILTAQHICDQDGGIFRGDGSTCEFANCEQPGACCFADGSCVVLTTAECSTAGGTYNGDGTLCGPVSCSTEPVLLKNGPLSTGTFSPASGQAPAGTSWSELQRPAANPLCPANIFGYPVAGTSRIADNVIVPSGDGWNIDTIEVFAYSTREANATHPPTTIPFTGGTIRIWDGPPNDAASQVIWGDTTTNLLVSSTFADIYRIGLASTPAEDFRRPIFRNELAIGGHLPPGEYWIDVGLTAASGGGFSPPVTLIGVVGASGGNSLQYVASANTWNYIIEPSTDPTCPPRRQELAFIVMGEEGPAPDECYANCDGSTTEPILNVDDFTCFINAFAAAQALPHAEQVTSYANCDNSTTAPVLNVDDFTCFIDAFAAGCP